MGGKVDVPLAKAMGLFIKQQREKKYPGRGGQIKCAADFGVSQPEWSRWERGLKTPSAANQRGIADFFGISIGELWGETPFASAPVAEPARMLGIEITDSGTASRISAEIDKISPIPIRAICSEVVRHSGAETPLTLLCDILLDVCRARPRVDLLDGALRYYSLVIRYVLHQRYAWNANYLSPRLVKKAKHLEALAVKAEGKMIPCSAQEVYETVQGMNTRLSSVGKIRNDEYTMQDAALFFLTGFIHFAENQLERNRKGLPASKVTDPSDELYEAISWKSVHEKDHYTQLAAKMKCTRDELQRIIRLNFELQETLNLGIRLLEKGRTDFESMKDLYLDALHEILYALPLGDVAPEKMRESKEFFSK